MTDQFRKDSQAELTALEARITNAASVEGSPDLEREQRQCGERIKTLRERLGLPAEAPPASA